MCDDGVGPKAGRKVISLFQEKIDYREVCESGLGLLDFIVGYQKVLIIDAIDQNLEPGSVVVFDAEKIKPINSPSAHSVGLPVALELGKRFALDLPEEIKIIGVQVKDATLLCENLTDEVKLSLDEVVKESKGILEKWIAEIY